MSKALKPYLSFNIKNNPQHMFAIVALLSIMLSFFTNIPAIDLNLHDTYFVVSAVHLCRLAALVFFMLWAIYTIIESVLPVIWLKWGHVLITLIAIVIISYSSAQLPIHGPHKYYAASQVQETVDINTIINIAIAIFLISQLLFIANMVIGIIKKTLSSSHRRNNRKI